MYSEALKNDNSSKDNVSLDGKNNCMLEQTGGGQETKPDRQSRLSHFVFSYIFLILLSAPLLFSLFGKDVSLHLIGENRNLTSTPDFKTTPIRDLPKKWDQYFKDRTPFRQVFMPGYIFVYEKALKTYVSEYVTGSGSELFMNHAAPVINAALEIRPYTQQAKENIRLTAAGKYAYYRSKGIPFYLFLPPDKSTLYPELLPFYATWIPHKTWYQEQVSTLQKANITFYPLNDFFRQFKDKERLYDVMYDNCHWNGNALVHVYDYMARTLAKDNPLFKPVTYGKYYGTVERQVSMSVYGKEQTTFIQLKHPENFSCPTLSPQYRTVGYNRLCTNKSVSKGSLWFFSDSYFGGTHGSAGVTPFVHDVHTYIHRHYNMGKKPYTELADETLKFSRPDAVIEEFVERMGGTQHSVFDPKLRVLGDFWMRTNGIFLEGRTDLSAFSLRNVDHPGQASNELVFKQGNLLSLKTPAVADDLGRVVVMGKLNVPANGLVRILYRDNETNTEKHQDFKIWKGSHIYHETIHVKPYSKVSLSLQFLTPGKYSFGKIQEIDDLRERM